MQGLRQTIEVNNKQLASSFLLEMKLLACMIKFKSPSVQELTQCP